MQTRRVDTVLVPEVPEDVRAELDAEERRQLADPGEPIASGLVPDDVRVELDLEARLAGEELRESLESGTPPAEPDPELDR